MVYLAPPHLASAARPSYGEAYSNILARHRRSPLTSASSVILLVAPDVDALCAARMLAELLSQDDVMHRIIPVSGIAELEAMKDELATYNELHTLILFNMGAILDLPSPTWFGEFSTKLTVHVIDSNRPQNLGSLFGGGDIGDRIVIWDDGEAENMEEERKAWEALEAGIQYIRRSPHFDKSPQYEPDPDSDEDSFSSSEDEMPFDSQDDVSESSRKRKLPIDSARSRAKRQKVNERHPSPNQMSRDQRSHYQSVVDKHYTRGSWYSQSASATIFILATVLERADRDLLWLAILGLTYQYTSSRISRDTYEKFHSVYHDEVIRLNPLPPSTKTTADAITALSPDDHSIRATEEFRFTLFRHWTLYDAMFHSSYVAGKLGIWKERGRKRLTGLLAKMGFSIPQTQQPYTHMDLDLKHQLRVKLDAIAPEYGLVELTYPSFIRCFGYRAPPLSAADAVEAISALLDVAGGVRIEVEVEGARHGGEWFGSGHVWKTGRPDVNDSAKVLPGENGGAHGDGGEDGSVAEERTEVPWWMKNFWAAYDALTDIVSLRDALSLSMSLHRAIIRQGTTIIDKQDIRTMRSHRVVVLSQGPDLALFAHPGVLSRLAYWLIDALRDKLPGTKFTHGKKSLPFILACLNESTSTYIVVGVMGALEFGDVRKNEFGLAFINAKDRCNARSSHNSFNTSVLEVDREDLKMFLEALCEVGEGY
ncbi:CDC45 family [Pisolithus orientalis]|uniref:CDC45 family n=1 Tax=Pisolithus orientalis TaxID=936130 RepID=UPI0022256249|nr:CDC45 family [Pisolithus orientalis]KAI6019747.1 CDC45 family [Pisolithus orientalis]